MPLADTLKRADADGRVAADACRAQRLWRALTPQMFRHGPLREALRSAQPRGERPTDEAQAMELAGLAPLLVEGSPQNLKVTTRGGPAAGGGRAAYKGGGNVNIRVGTGFDAHAFGPGDSVALGGVRIAHSRGVVAHSDGDVLLHALCDALLGAAGLGDIGAALRGYGCALEGCGKRALRHRGDADAHQPRLAVGNVGSDAACAGAADRRASGSDPQQRRAPCWAWSVERVNLKATTTEYMGFVGRAEGLAALATVLVQQAVPPAVLR